MSLFNPVKIVTPSSLEVVSLSEAKAHLKVDDDSNNGLIRLYLQAAVRRCEDYRQASIMSAEHELYTDYFYNMSLQKHPVSAINSVKYYDEDGDLQTVDSSDYRLQDFLQPCRIEFDSGFDCPDLEDRQFPVVINFNAGWTSASSVPATIKLAVLEELGTFHEIRQNAIYGNGLSSVEIKEVSMALLDAESMWI